MLKRILLLDKIIKFVIGGCIDNVLQCLRLIDCLHHQVDIIEDFSHILVLALGWIEVGAESINKGEVTQVGYIHHSCINVMTF